jgi:site-specific DNA-methyltransferase (adenine-specific)
VSAADVLEGRTRWCVETGDCLEILPTMPDRSVAHVITDPPYSADVHAKQWVSKALSADGDKRAASDHAEIGFACLTDAMLGPLVSFFGHLARRWSLVFCDLESISRWRETVLVQGYDYVRTCIWDKVDSAPQFTGDRPASGAEAIVLFHPKGRKAWNGGGGRNVFRHTVNSGIDRGAKNHPTQKPFELMTEIVELFTDPGEVILDPFCGSGTTGVAALRLGRRFIGIEKDAKYAQLARDRIAAEEQGSTLQAKRAGQEPLFR